MANSRIPGPIGLMPTPIIDSGTLVRTDSPVPGLIGTRGTLTHTTEKAKLDLIFDISQLVLDIAGVVDPTPVSDGANALIAMSRGHWWDVAISAISIVPYVGDLAKLSKLPHYLRSIEKAIDLARMNVIWASQLRPVLENLKPFLDNVLDIGGSTLPKSAVKSLNGMKKAIDNFLMRNRRGGGLGVLSKRSRGEITGKLDRSATGERYLKSSSQSGLKTSKDRGTMGAKDVLKRAPEFANLKQMDREYVGEETGAIWGTKVKYLDRLERQQYQLYIKEGKFYDANGKLFDSSAARSAFGGQGNAIFIMDEYGSIYASTVHSPGKFHHSSFFAGQPVASAGEIVVDNGVLRTVTRRSGHYQPTSEQLDQFLQKLDGNGVNLNKVNVGAGF